MPRPTFTLEKSFSGIVAGIDEAGVGPWAGPVVAAAVILNKKKRPSGINDSKALLREQREELFSVLILHSSTGIGIATVEEIDTLNIYHATRLAMCRAFEALLVVPDVALIDGHQPPKLPCHVQAIVGGDGKCMSIAAAGIVAKVTRDRIMGELAAEFPHYGWEKNAGYGTKRHQSALLEYGHTAHHRKSFSPIRNLIAHGRLYLEEEVA
jgi:ribonuclease HII